ncbi:50S ribosomal protein L16 [Candidatus Pacearchaeota archaeon]|nr:50S ribosomal protein L16 [Candidatus Pacearchaeota archaeon]
MALRKASAYSKKKARPFTRKSRNKNRAYIKTVPGSKIAKFHQGAAEDYRAGKHSFFVRIIANQKTQIRDNALESCRMYLTKILDEQILGQYYLALKVYPHHILRENKLSAGAGADRISTGMTHSYGVVIGRAAIVNAGQEIFFISCSNEKAARLARDMLNVIKAKLPCATKVSFSNKS